MLSFISGISLLFISFGLEKLIYTFSFLGLGLAAIWAAIGYTAGKNAYGYKALGDVFVFIFFGLVGVLGSCFLFTETLELIDILPASACGLFAVGVLNLNNTRDIENDRASGKTTIPVLIGVKWAKIYQGVLIEVAYWFLIGYGFLTNFYGVFLIVLTFPIVISSIGIFRNGKGKELDPLLKKMAITSFLSSILFLIGIII